MTTTIGQGIDRVDGPLKVTGGAQYTAEIAVPGLVHAAVVGATIPSGRVTAVDASAAMAASGVIAVLTKDDMPKVNQPPLMISLVGIAAPGETFFPMQDDVVHYAGQPVAIVIAESHESAQYGATLVRVSYQREPSVTTIDEGRDDAYEPQTIFAGFMPGHMSRGDVDKALNEASHRVDLDFALAANHHNPLEPSATTAVWDGDNLTLYESTQGITATQATVCAFLRLSPSQVRVITHFVGGSFGCKAMVWPHSTLTAMVARIVGRPVKLSLTRPQMFTSCGHREEQEQSMSLAATDDGHITGIKHSKTSITSHFDDWCEPAFTTSQQLYNCANYDGTYHLVHGNLMTSTFTRGPGEGIGIFVIESVMDQLATDLGIDPIELRMRNIADTDPVTGNPWSSHGLRECILTGAQSFGWNARHHGAPLAQREGNQLIGTGMAAVGYTHPIFNPTQRARARIYNDGHAVVQIATQEFGVGTATAMTQVAADTLGVPLDDMRCEIGDTNLPNASACVGSAGAAMISAAIFTASTALREQLIGMAVKDPKSPLHEANPDDVEVIDGRMSVRDVPDSGEAYGDLLKRHFLNDVEALGSWDAPPLDTPYGMVTFGAQFAEVAVDADLGLIRVRRMEGAFAPGRVLNEKLAKSQLMGGMLWGLGQALLEGNHMDTRYGRWAATSLGDYLVSVNADIPEVNVDVVEVTDEVVNPLGVKGVGEVGQIGAAAAIANAVFNATGYRPTTLPISPEQLLDALPTTARARA